MAITLEDLLGKSEPKTSMTGKDFPTYEDFKAMRNGEVQKDSYASQPRYENSQNASRADFGRNYSAREDAFNSGDYAFYDSMRTQGSTMTAPQNYADEAKYGYSQYETFAKPGARQTEKVQSLYEYTKNDNDRQSEQVLMDKLEHTNAGSRPIFDREITASPVQKKSLFRNKSESVQQNAAETKKHARLNTKGKIILGVYIGVIVLVAVLIIVNANKINGGTAKAPSSSVNEFASSQYVGGANISEAMTIDSKYEARI